MAGIVVPGFADDEIKETLKDLDSCLATVFDQHNIEKTDQCNLITKGIVSLPRLAGLYSEDKNKILEELQLFGYNPGLVATPKEKIKDTQSEKKVEAGLKKLQNIQESLGGGLPSSRPALDGVFGPCLSSIYRFLA